MQNRTYLGEIVHKGQSHPGEHTPIDQLLLWDAAQAQLAGNTAERNSGTRTRQPSLLTGMLFDANGNPMTPSHAVKKGTRYRYYVSRALIIKDQTKSSAGLRIPAEEIEPLVPAACANGFSIPAASTVQYGLSMRQRSAGSWREPENSATAGPACPRHASVPCLLP